MANENGWGDGASNNDIGWGKGADNAIGWGSVYSVSSAGLTDIIGTPAVDPDAQAFITAASITDPTQQSAINQLVIDLKGYNIWTKMKALYPFCGSTASQHKWNLKDPRDLDVAFRIVWSGGVTHSANGVQFGGVNGYGDTKLTPSISLGDTNVHTSYYSRTNPSTIASNQILFDSFLSSASAHQFYIDTSKILYSDTFSTFIGRTTATLTRTDSFFLASRITGGQKIFRAGTQIASTSTNGGTRPNIPLFIGAANTTGGAVAFSNFQTAFASIGDGLTDTEAANLYTAVQAFQTTLGRSIGTQTVSDADAQAFVTNAGIVDQVEANAVNNLVIGLKADGLWTKMQAVYPMVGGTSTSNSYNLKNTAQYQITWNGGITFSSTGVLPNGTNGYGQTGFSFNSTTALSSHISTYIKTNSTTLACEFGSGNSGGTEECFIVRNGSTYLNNQCDAQTGRLNPSVADARGLILNSRTANNSWKTYRNGSSLATGTNVNSYTGGSSYILNLFRRGGVGTNDLYSAKECAFASIGDGLTDTDAANLYNRVQTFNTALARQV